MNPIERAQEQAWTEDLLHATRGVKCLACRDLIVLTGGVNSWCGECILDVDECSACLRDTCCDVHGHTMPHKGCVLR